MAKKLGSDGRPIDVPTKPTPNDDVLNPKKADDRRKGVGASPHSGASSSGSSRSDAPRSGASSSGTSRTRNPPSKTRSPGTGGRAGIDLGDEPTVALGARRRQGGGASGSGEETRPALSFPTDAGEPRSGGSGSAGPSRGRQYRPGDEGDTVLWSGANRPDREDEATAASRATRATRTSRAAQIHPVTGWLVVVDGPGKGSAAQLGFGHNTIGRGPAMRVRLDFGDRKISRDTHATLTYDPKGNAFYLQQGKNLAYIEGEPVLTPVRLEAGALIGLGDTTLRFVPFCDDAFTWE